MNVQNSTYAEFRTATIVAITADTRRKLESASDAAAMLLKCRPIAWIRPTWPVGQATISIDSRSGPDLIVAYARHFLGGCTESRGKRPRAETARTDASQPQATSMSPDAEAAGVLLRLR
jgi:hypothetical protein